MNKKIFSRIIGGYYLLGVLILILTIVEDNIFNFSWLSFGYAILGGVCATFFLIKYKGKKKEEDPIHVLWRMLFLIYTISGFVVALTAACQMWWGSLEGNGTAGYVYYIQEKQDSYLEAHISVSVILFIAWITQKLSNWIEKDLRKLISFSTLYCIAIIWVIYVVGMCILDFPGWTKNFLSLIGGTFDEAVVNWNKTRYPIGWNSVNICVIICYALTSLFTFKRAKSLWVLKDKTPRKVYRFLASVLSWFLFCCGLLVAIIFFCDKIGVGPTKSNKDMVTAVVYLLFIMVGPCVFIELKELWEYFKTK